MLSEIKSVKKYPNLSWTWKNDVPYITGDYFFNAEYKGIVLKECFKILVSFPSDYPNSLPHAFELDGKIETCYHHFLSDGSLCLGTEIDLYKIFSMSPCLDTFMTEILNPYLYRWLYIKRFGKEPWIDRSHGNEGIIESYAEALEIPADKSVVEGFLALLMGKKTRANSLCPCNSGKKVKCCHRKKLDKLLTTIPSQVFLRDWFNLRGDNRL